MKAVIAPIPHAYKEVVRVAVNNNFNCTEAEYQQLAGYVQKYPARFFFVNSNVKTPRLLTLNDHSHKVVVTANPDLTVRESDVLKIYKLDPALIGFVRVKYIPESQPIVDLIQKLSEEKIKVVITIQRFNGKRGLDQHASRDHYKFSCNRYRLHGEALAKVHALTDRTPGVAICDRSGLGCQGCGLCSTLTLGERVKISSLNLSTSGICPYNCVDCYAKTLQHFSMALGNTPIIFDKIRQNDKQSGRSEHIKHAKEALGVQ